MRVCDHRPMRGERVTERVTFVTWPEQLRRLERWRARQSPIPSRNDAIRRLLGRQLDAEGVPFDEAQGQGDG
jgi:hypothetical protein